MKTVNIPLNERLHKNAKLISVLKNMKLNDYLAKAIKQAVEKEKKLIEDIRVR